MEVKSHPAASLRLNSPILPILAGALLAMQLLDGYRGWAILLVGLGGAWLISFFWARSLARSLHLKREMRFGWAQVGDRLEERFTVSNAGRFPALWIEVHDHSTLPDYRPGRVTGVGGLDQSFWRTEGICTRRGLFTLGPTTLRTADPFGFYSVEIKDPAAASLLILPPVIPLPFIEVAPGGRAGEGRPRPDAHERTASASGVRAYVPGDSLRWIHWPTSARHDQLHVHLLDSTPSSDWWIFLDMDQRIQAGEGQASTEEHSVILAASLAEQGLRMGRAVGLVAAGQELVWLPPQSGRERRWEILRALALVNQGNTSLANLLAHTNPALERGASLVIITPNSNGDWLEALLSLTWRGAVPTVLLLDPVSFGGNGDVAKSTGILASMGISSHIIDRQLLDRPEARPGEAGQWEWRVTISGRAVAVKKPRDLSWKALS